MNIKSNKIIQSEEQTQKIMKQRRSKRNYVTPLTKMFIASAYLTLLLSRTIQTSWEKTPNFCLLSQSVSSVTQSCPTLCDPMNRSRPGLPIHHQLPESTQIQWRHPTISSSVVPYPPALNRAQHQGLSQWVSSSRQVAKDLEFQLQHQSFQWTLRTDLL